VFPRLAYLRWMHDRQAAAAVDLGSSDQRLGDALDRLEPLPDPPDGHDLRARLAAELDVAPAQVLVTAGASHANVIAAATALTGSRREVLVETPGYEPLSGTPRGLGATVRTFERPAADGFALDPDRVSAALTDETAHVAVTDRHNPSGRRADPVTLEVVAAAARDRGARLLVDEVYAPFDLGPADRPGLGGGTAAGLEGTVVTGSVTKFLGLGDLRIGWLVADEGFVERARDVVAHVPALAGTSERLAARAFADRAGQVERARRRAVGNAARLAAFVDGRDDLDGTVHEACPFAFVAHREADGDAVAEAAWAAGVLVVPGRFFGLPSRFRLGATADGPTTERGLAALGRVLDAL